MRIIVIDDDVNILKLLETALKMMGHATYAAQSGKEAMKLVLNNQIDLIISDLVMPEMSGLEVAKQIRARGFKMPFILLTGSLFQEVAPDSISEVISKPVSLTDLKLVIEKFTKEANEKTNQ